jgi:hypothetical protein
MQTSQVFLLSICAITFVVIELLIYWGNNYSLNLIKSKTVGDGQHGTAKFANKQKYERCISSYIDSISFINNCTIKNKNYVSDLSLSINTCRNTSYFFKYMAEVIIILKAYKFRNLGYRDLRFFE